MTRIQRAGHGNRIPPATIRMEAVDYFLKELKTALKKCQGAGHLFLKVTPQDVEFIRPQSKRDKDRANLLLYLSGYPHVIDNLPSPRAQKILKVKGYQSIFLVSKIETLRPAAPELAEQTIDPGLKTQIKEKVLKANQAVLDLIVDEVRSPETVWSTNPKRCQKIKQLARLHDPEGEVAKILDNGNIFVYGLNHDETSRLTSLFSQIVGDFDKDKVMRGPSALARKHRIETAPTAAHETRDAYGSAILKDNLLLLRRALKDHDPSQNVYLKADQANGMLRIVATLEESNVVLSWARYKLDITKMKPAKQRVMNALNLSLPIISVVNAIYIDPILLDPTFLNPNLRDRVNIQAFFSAMVNQLNQNLCKEFIESIKFRVYQARKLLKNEDLAPLAEQLEAIKNAGLQVYSLLKQT